MARTTSTSPSSTMDDAAATMIVVMQRSMAARHVAYPGERGAITFARSSAETRPDHLQEPRQERGTRLWRVKTRWPSRKTCSMNTITNVIPTRPLRYTMYNINIYDDRTLDLFLRLLARPHCHIAELSLDPGTYSATV